MLNSGAERPRLLPPGLVHIGNNVIHHTHEINTCRGLVSCRVCGASASHRGSPFIKLLGRKCMPPGTYGKNKLNKLGFGNKPGVDAYWLCNLLHVATQELVRSEALSQFEGPSSGGSLCFITARG